MKLYHGSNVAFKEIDLAKCRPNKDFGRGFYLTPDRTGAEKMALRAVRRFGGTPFVMTFALLFRQFELGLVTIEMLVREMKFKQLTVQFSFHTEQAINALKFVGVDDVH